MRGTTMGNVSLLGIDLAKASFQLHGNDERGKRVVSKTLGRKHLESFIANLPPCTIAMEACATAHWWGGRFAQYGHSVKLIAPQFVKPYVKGNKNDRADAEAIAEAASRPSMRFVPLKTATQLDVQAIHRVRTRLVAQRTALTNEMRGILMEQGIALAQGIDTLTEFVATLIAGAPETLVTPMCRETMIDLRAELAEVQEHIAVAERRLEQYARDHDAVQRLMTVPGVGMLTATAVVAAVPDPRVFKNGRQFAAWLGLVPRHEGTGGADKNRNGSITKRGDRYLRSLLVHGARAVLRLIDKRSDHYGKWAMKLKAERGYNRAAVAVANKNARVIWALLAGTKCFDADVAACGHPA
jgi:transposase